MNRNKQIKWGVLGGAWIASERVIPAIQKAGNGEMYAIASRNEKKASNLAKQHDIPHVYGSYDELLNDPDIDAVYIPLPNHLHGEWTIRAAEAGKHVLCEKPAALNEKEIAEMVTACRNNGVLFMEAFAFRCHPEWRRLKHLLNEGHIGDIRNVQGRYSIMVDSKKDIRLDPTLGGGSLYDIGSYCVNAIMYIMGDEPIKINGFSQLAPDNGVDLSMAVSMKFPGGRLAQFDCSFEGEYNQSIEITGTEGIIKIKFPFQHPQLTILKNGKEEQDAYSYQENGYVAQIEHFSDCVLSGESLFFTPEESITNMKVIDTIYKSL